MSKPSSKPEFATDVGALIADPGASKRHAGFLVDEAIPAHWLNWLFHNESDWIDYLDDLPNDTDFTDEDFAWGGTHSHTGAVHHAASIFLDSGSVAVEYQTPPPRVSFLELAKSVPGGNASYSHLSFIDGCPQLSTVGSGETIRVPFRLPLNAEISQVRASVFHGGAYNCTMAVRRKASSIGGINAVNAVGAPVAITSVSGIQTITRSGLSFFTTAGSEYWVEFEFSNAASYVTAVEVTWNDPGPLAQVT